MKLCNGCSETKPMDAFNKDAKRKDGRQNRCKDCNRAYRAANAARIADNNRRYQQVNKERLSAYNRDWSQRNKDSKNEASRAYYQRNREKTAERMHRYRLENLDAYAARSAKRRALARENSHEPYSRAEIFAAYSHECAYCGASAEHIDHVVPISKGGPDAAHNLLPACAPCNLGKSDKSLAEWALTWLA